MRIDEIKLLLPFFVGGTLDREERKEVEKALKTCAELRTDLGFWQQIRIATIAAKTYVTEVHKKQGEVSAHDKTPFTDEASVALSQRLQVSTEHPGGSRPIRRRPGGRGSIMLGFLTHAVEQARGSRVVHATSVLSTVAAAILLINTIAEPPQTDQAITSTDLPKIAEKLAHGQASVWSTWQPEVRSATNRLDLILEVGTEKQVRVYAAIPQNRESGIQYRVAISAPGKRPFPVEESLRRYGAGGGYDSLQFVFPRELLPPAGNSIAVTITEILPHELISLKPEEYRFQIDRKSKH